jgi:hypothetical protein
MARRRSRHRYRHRTPGFLLTVVDDVLVLRLPLCWFRRFLL